MTHVEPRSVLWQTTSWSWYNWNDFPPPLNHDTEQRFQLWMNSNKDPRLAEYSYVWGRTGTTYAINFERMEQQRMFVRADDPPRPLRRVVVSHARATP